jgi:hypothetical protein
LKGTNRTPLGFIERYDRIGGLQVVLNPLSSHTPTSQLSGGIIAGLSEAYGAIDDVVNQMNQLAVQITTGFKLAASPRRYHGRFARS